MSPAGTATLEGPRLLPIPLPSVHNHARNAILKRRFGIAIALTRNQDYPVRPARRWTVASLI